MLKTGAKVTLTFNLDKRDVTSHLIITEMDMVYKKGSPPAMVT